MSTKSSLVSGSSFHLYEECFDPAKNVWLELEGCDFEATPRGLRIEIPLTIWEVIRQHTPARYDLAALTDAQLLTEAKKRVDGARAEYRAALAEHRARPPKVGRKRRPATVLSILYRDARLPREEHLAATLAKLREERAAQRKLQRTITRLATPKLRQDQPLALK